MAIRVRATRGSAQSLGSCGGSRIHGVRWRDRNKTVITRRIMVVHRRIRPSSESARIGGSGAPRAAQAIASQWLGSQIQPQGTVTANLLFVGSIPTGASRNDNELASDQPSRSLGRVRLGTRRFDLGARSCQSRGPSKSSTTTTSFPLPRFSSMNRCASTIWSNPNRR